MQGFDLAVQSDDKSVDQRSSRRHAAALALQIEGPGKAETFARALEDGPVADMPIRAALREAGERLTLFQAAA